MISHRFGDVDVVVNVNPAEIEIQDAAVPERHSVTLYMYPKQAAKKLRKIADWLEKL